MLGTAALRRNWRQAIPILSITAVAAALRFWGIGFGLPHIYARPDEDATFAIATHIYRDGPNPHFFVYPTLYLYLVAFTYELYYAVLSAGGQALTMSAFLERAGTDPTMFYLLARTATAILGTATVPLLFDATRRLFDVRTATIAAVLLAAAFLHVRDSHFGVTDIPATFMATLAFWAIVRSTLDRWQRVLLAGMLCGLAGSTKYNAILIGLPLFVRLVQQSWYEPRRRPSSSGSDAERHGAKAFASGGVAARPSTSGSYAERHGAKALSSGGGAPRGLNFVRMAAPVSVAAAGIVVGFLAGTPFAVVDHQLFLSHITGVQTHFLEGHMVDLGRGWSYHLIVSLRYGLGAPMLVAALLGSVWLAIAAPATALVALSFPATYYFVIGAGRTVFLRYIDPILPFCCMLAAVAIAGIAGKAGRAAAAVAVLLTVAVVWPSAYRSVAFDRLIAERDNRLVVADWLESSFPPRTTLCQTGSLYGKLQFRDPGRFSLWGYDEGRGSFRAGGSPVPEFPELVVIQRSPLPAYPGFPESLMPVLRDRYRSIRLFAVEKPAPGRPPVYDLQDAFFAPLDGFERLMRPGPTFEVFQRVQ